MKRLALVVALGVGIWELGVDGGQARADWRLIVLGRAQDAGIPQIGCQRSPCTDIRAGTRRAEKVASLGLVDRVSGTTILFDATPDLPAQVHALTGGPPPDSIFLTHAHMGHYTGLMYLGRESMNAKGVPVYGTERMVKFLAANGPWSQLVQLGNITLRVISPGEALSERSESKGGGDMFSGNLRVTSFRVPHRDELTDTVGYRIEGPRRSAIFIPDIDRWEKWDRSIRQMADSVDLAFLDGTFSSPAEVNRPIEEIPHPMMPHTRALLKGARAAIWFIHINHTNEELDAKDVVREGQQFEI